MRLALETCSPDEDIQLFLKENETGRKRPGKKKIPKLQDKESSAGEEL